MPHVTVTIECEPNELRDVLRRMLGTVTTEAVDPFSLEPVAPDDPEDGDELWDREDLTRLLNEIKPEARAILGELAKRPDGYSFDDLQQTLHLEGLTVGGQLSSVGHAKRR